jgi:hypothetical protein
MSLGGERATALVARLHGQLHAEACVEEEAPLPGAPLPVHARLPTHLTRLSAPLQEDGFDLDMTCSLNPLLRMCIPTHTVL